MYDSRDLALVVANNCTVWHKIFLWTWTFLVSRFLVCPVYTNPLIQMKHKHHIQKLHTNTLMHTHTYINIQNICLHIAHNPVVIKSHLSKDHDRIRCLLDFYNIWVNCTREPYRIWQDQEFNTSSLGPYWGSHQQFNLNIFKNHVLDFLLTGWHPQ